MMHPLRWTAIVFALVLFTSFSWAQNSEQSAASRFGAPEELTANGKPIRGISYPSPTLHDIDGDSRRELLIGDLRGYIHVSQPNKDSSDLKWSERQKLNAADGKPLKLNNW
ncbi:MAG: hypothetical protein QF752_02210 [Planctomycetota bacterium]|nr:hypothetical protein [Planctomycetota bacterium]